MQFSQFHQSVTMFRVVILLIANYLLNSYALSIRGQQLQMNLTLELKALVENLDQTFLPVADFHNDMKTVIADGLKSEDATIKEYMDANQYKYYGLVYRFERSAQDNKGKVLVANAALRDFCEKLTKDIDAEFLRLEDVLLRRGCKESKVSEHMDEWFEKVQLAINFELNHLRKLIEVGEGAGTEASFVLRNVITNLFECSAHIDLACYKNNQELFDTHDDFVETTYNGYAQYHIENIDSVQNFLSVRVTEDIDESSNSAWLMSCVETTTATEESPTSRSTTVGTTTDAPEE